MTDDGADVKLAQTDYEILELLRRRWSPRAFADRAMARAPRTRRPIAELAFAGAWGQPLAKR
ncbi:MAG: hypothetical protein QF463_15940 [Vicinamibacterales bacterium]|jgi:hypothetical protein|nr:hypothetical protein [Vicinamibacterales bacterium]MDP6610556.1 hypothetical protein [Vicinamibacterales bacterium]MDP7294437.1 hypothetical protein [Vicinamibacterales bacterium]MDP7471152.1 hypothetical protein [Vicinamibacterales bacterium]MDP7672492.1 hypothetical protein [Vicinamibacterales bacterium]|tara:strand:+ start:866 stop:1051 length:186 start_codon:yes stop_codon:yes gene_type:complete